MSRVSFGGPELDEEEERMPTVAERVAGAVAPVLEGLGLVLYDVEHTGGSIRVVVDRNGDPTSSDPTSSSIGVDDLAAATRAVSRLLDELDPVEGRYTLEVSSPGLERPLRTPAHFRRALGAEVSVKTNPGVEGERRFTGIVADADDDTVSIRLDDGSHRRLRYDDLERARTTFAWGPGPKPGQPKPRKQATS